MEGYMHTAEGDYYKKYDLTVYFKKGGRPQLITEYFPIYPQYLTI